MKVLLQMSQIIGDATPVVVMDRTVVEVCSMPPLDTPVGELLMLERLGIREANGEGVRGECPSTEGERPLGVEHPLAPGDLMVNCCCD